VRLLKLPDSVQAKISSGEIIESTARKLLTVQRIDPKAAEKAAAEIAKLEQPDAQEIDLELESAIASRKDVVRMEYLWPLTWQHNGTVRPLTISELTAALTLKKKDYGTQPRIEALASSLAAGMQVEPADYPEFPAETVSRFQHVSNPPACADCPFHARLDGTDYCGLRDCYDRKTQAYLVIEAERMSKELGIAVYDPETDPRPSATYESEYGDDAQSFAGLITRRSDKLRLMIKPRGWDYPRTKSEHIAVVNIAPRKKEKLASSAEEKASAKEHARQVREREKQERTNKDIELAQAFIQQVAAPVFAQVFEGLTCIDVMVEMVHFDRYDEGWKEFQEASKPKQKKILQTKLAARLLDCNKEYNVVPHPWKNKSPLLKGPSGVAVFLEDVAKKWGVKLPKNFLDTAKEWDHKEEQEES